jgi:hypothetical protein
MPEFNHATIIDHETVFPKGTLAAAEIIRNSVSLLNSAVAFEIIARLNYTARFVAAKDYHQEIAEWFGKDHPGLIKKYGQLVTIAYANQPKAGHLKLVNLWSNLKLLEYIMENRAHEASPDGFDHGQATEQLLHAYLAINGMFTKRSDAVPSTIPGDLPLWQQYFFDMALRLLPYHDLVYIKADLLLFVQFFKAGYFFQFFQEFAPLLLAKFIAQYDIADWQEYLKGVMPVADHAMRTKRDGIGYLVIDPKSAHVNKSDKILTSLAVGSHLKYDQAADFKLVRAHPLMKVSDGKFLVGDEMLVYNRIYNSLYFEFAELAAKHPELLRKGDFKGLFNEHFTENYLVKKILGDIFAAKGNGVLHYTGVEIQQKFPDKKRGEPDYYARDGKQIIVFEIKDSLISGAVKQSGNYQLLHKELVDKFYYATEIKKDGSIKEHPKAIRQLLNTIGKLLSKTAKYDQAFNADQVIVYPVMLYLDQALSTPGINDIIQEWFTEELKKRPELWDRRDQIRPITLIDVDTVILYHNDFKSGRINFEQFIEGYWNWKMQHKMTGINTQSNELINKSLTSFGAFLRENVNIETIADVILVLGESLFREDEKDKNP